MHTSNLQQLARLYGLETSFYDGLGGLRTSADPVIVKVLRSLGAELESEGEVEHALRVRRWELDTRFVEPVVVQWGETPLVLDLQAADRTSGSLQLRLEGEAGEPRRFEVDWENLPLLQEHATPSGLYQKRRLVLEPGLSFGYHSATLELGSLQAQVTVIAAPEAAYAGELEERLWGAFVPAYSLHSARSWGGGDLTDLTEFSRWLADAGGRFLGTLPFYAAFLDRPLDPSPYAPVSRLFWNEFYLDVEKAAEWNQSPAARALVQSPDFQRQLDCLRRAPLVDYREQMRLKRSVLEILARGFFERGGGELAALEAFRSSGGQVEDYAAFRAAHETQGVPWPMWEARQRSGTLRSGDYDQTAFEYHLYAQWLIQQQFCEYRAAVRSRRVGLYLDLPLGVHPDGYDAWRDTASFAQEVSGGAPPDSFFTAGQDWGFRPLHPERTRWLGHAYFRKSLGWLLEHTDLIRIDHAMSLQRLYWVPYGAGAADGVYVHYPAEELFAILILESHRKQCVIVGEDLGTVPPDLRERMDRHRVHRMYVGQFESSAERWPPVNPVPTGVVASLNTHDTPTTQAFLQGADIELRREMGLLSDEAGQGVRQERLRLVDALRRFFDQETDLGADPEFPLLLQHWLTFLARSPARFVLVNLEDLWRETEPQNVPGTGSERPNWRRKSRLPFEAFSTDRRVLQILQAVNAARAEAGD